MSFTPRPIDVSTSPASNRAQLERTIRILVLDDDLATTRRMRALCAEYRHLTIAGVVRSAAEAQERLSAVVVDVVVIGTVLEGGALGAVKTLVRACPSLPCLICGDGDDGQHATRAVAAGASGYVDRSESLEALAEAIRTAERGEVYMSHSLARKVLARILFTEAPAAAHENELLADSMQLDRLSDREMQVFQLLAEGCTPSDISDRLGIQQRTTRLHLRHIQRKLDARSYADVLKLSAEWQGRAHWTTRVVSH